MTIDYLFFLALLFAEEVSAARSDFGVLRSNHHTMNVHAPRATTPITQQEMIPAAFTKLMAEAGSP